MPIFDEHGFDKGTWAAPLARILRNADIIEDRVPKVRLYRATWTHWIQFEPEGFPGPAHWIGKPAVTARDGNLYAGYYVERGYRSHPQPEYVITPEWHWHAFVSCIDDDARRKQIDARMQGLDPAIRCLAIFSGEEPGPLPYQGESTLIEAAEITRARPYEEWIDLFLGIRLSRKECRSSQKDVSNRIAPALTAARTIEDVVRDARDDLP